MTEEKGRPKELSLVVLIVGGTLLLGAILMDALAGCGGDAGVPKPDAGLLETVCEFMEQRAMTCDSCASCLCDPDCSQSELEQQLQCLYENVNCDEWFICYKECG